MKKLFTLLVLMGIGATSFSQNVLLSQNFDTYTGDSASIPAGYTITWNSAVAPASFYSSAGNFGQAPNSYKFGKDSAIMITPNFSGADSLSFWHKGNVINGSASRLYIYSSSDGINYLVLDSITTIPTTGTVYKHDLDSSAHYLKFIYRKVSGNMAFDDLSIFNYQGVGINAPELLTGTFVYPNPSSTGLYTLEFGKGQKGLAEVFVFNSIGNLVCSKSFVIGSNEKNQLDLSKMPAGFYFASIKSSTEKKMIRLVNKN
jgi:hypothetical protein